MEHIETLQAARVRLVERRRELAGAIGTAAQRRIRGSIAGLIQVQAAIATVDQAIAEESAAAKAEKRAKKAPSQIRSVGMKDYNPQKHSRK